MKNDLDRLMAEAGMDGLWITGRLPGNAAARYFAGGAHLTEIDIIKTAGKAATLFHGPMERQEAASTGLDARTRTNDAWFSYLERANDNTLLAKAWRLADEFRECGLAAGRVAVYGKIDPGVFLAIERVLNRELPDLDLIAAGQGPDVLALARRTKSQPEIEEIQDVGRRTIQVVELVEKFLTSQQVQDDHLVTASDEALTVGDVKSQVHLWLAERGLEASEGIILAPGSQAGYPHSSGEANSPIPIGQSIIFDIFPRKLGGGYFFDFTRTWCLGEASQSVLQAHRDVLAVFEELKSAMVVGADTKDLQIQADRSFEELGYLSRLSTPGTTDGFFHGLGHGIGLEIHEDPWFDEQGARTTTLEPNMVLTLEPGLYYPDDGFGVRIEDTVVIDPDRGAVSLVPYPTGLVLALRGDGEIRKAM